MRAELADGDDGRATGIIAYLPKIWLKSQVVLKSLCLVYLVPPAELHRPGARTSTTMTPRSSKYQGSHC